MSTSKTVNAHRRPATYSKIPRHPRLESDSTTIDRFVKVANLKIQGLQPLRRVPSQAKNLSSGSSSPSTENTKEAKKVTRQSCSTSSTSQQHSCLYDVHATPLHEEPVRFTSHQESIYDVPSSCEEIDTTRRSLGRKRRKIEVNADDPGNSMLIGLENRPERSLQDQGTTSRNHQKVLTAHVVVNGEQSCNQQLRGKRYDKPSVSTDGQDPYQPISGSIMKSPRPRQYNVCDKQQFARSAKDLAPLRNPRKKAVSANSYVSQQYRAPIKHTRSTEPHIAQYWFTSESPSKDGVEHESGGRDKTYISPLRTPSGSPRSKHEVLTPRQRELWSKLLVDESRNVNQTCAKKINHENVDNLTERSRKGEASVARTATERCSTSVSARRHRIVERLREREQFEINSQISAPSEEDHTNSMVNRLVSDKPQNEVTEDTPPVENNSVAKIVATYSAVEAGYPNAPPQCVGASKLTYARQRSYLTEDSLDAAKSFSESILMDTDARQTSQCSVVTAPDPAICLETQGEVDSDHKSEGGAIRSIHELREAGGNARLAGEMETILDDLDEDMCNQKFKRARLLELVVKLREIEYRRYFINQGWEKRLLAHVGLSRDVLMDTLFVAAMLYLIAGSSTAPLLDQFCRRRIVVFLLKTMENDTDLDIILKDKKINISKVTLSDYVAFLRSFKQSAVWRFGAPDSVTPHVCVLQCIEYLARHVRVANGMTELLSQGALDRIIRTLDYSCTDSAYSSGSLLRCHLIVSIAESCTISVIGRSSEQYLTAAAVAKIAQLLPRVATWPDKESGNLLTSILRLYLNLTNNNATLCEAFSTEQIITAICGIVISQFWCTSAAAVITEEELLLDTLILSLGALINIVECSDLARLLIKDLRNGSVSILDLLVDLFSTKLTETVKVSNCINELWSQGRADMRRPHRRQKHP